MLDVARRLRAFRAPPGDRIERVVRNGCYRSAGLRDLCISADVTQPLAETYEASIAPHPLARHLGHLNSPDRDDPFGAGPDDLAAELEAAIDDVQRTIDEMRSGPAGRRPRRLTLQAHCHVGCLRPPGVSEGRIRAQFLRWTEPLER